VWEVVHKITRKIAEVAEHPLVRARAHLSALDGSNASAHTCVESRRTSTPCSPPMASP
jgi:hypothetical protein